MWKLLVILAVIKLYDLIDIFIRVDPDKEDFNIFKAIIETSSNQTNASTIG